ncbi:MAG: hypothetical protein WAL91_02595, partial [Propionicimonas sp.]
VPPPRTPPMKRFITSLAAVTLAAASLWSPTPTAAVAAAVPAVAAPAADSASTFVVATYNVRCANCSKKPANSRERLWEVRAPVIVAAVKANDVDLLGVQEASSGVLYPGGPSQFENLLSRLGEPFALANGARYNCVRDWTPSRCSYRNQGASQDSRILYKTTKFTLLDDGSLALDARSVGNGSARYLAWARFTELATGKQFYFATAHLEPGMSKGKIATRRAQTYAAIAELNRVNTDNLPIIWGSDLASSKLSHSGNTAYDIFLAAGYTDPLGNYYKARTANGRTYAANIVNGQYFTLNNFAPAPKQYAKYKLGAHLDYVLLKPQMRVEQWKQVLNLAADGSFAGVIPSDHNLVVVTLALP